MFVENVENVLANVLELLLDLVPVGPDHAELVLAALVLLLLLDAGDDAPARPPGPDHVLVSHRQQVPLLHRQLHVERGDILHGLDHF